MRPICLFVLRSITLTIQDIKKKIKMRPITRKNTFSEIHSYEMKAVHLASDEENQMSLHTEVEYLLANQADELTPHSSIMQAKGKSMIRPIISRVRMAFASMISG
jgi:hypothetical protein